MQADSQFSTTCALLEAINSTRVQYMQKHAALNYKCTLKFCAVVCDYMVRQQCQVGHDSRQFMPADSSAYCQRTSVNVAALTAICTSMNSPPAMCGSTSGCWCCCARMDSCGALCVCVSVGVDSHSSCSGGGCAARQPNVLMVSTSCAHCPMSEPLTAASPLPPSLTRPLQRAAPLLHSHPCLCESADLPRVSIF